ncbi:DUF5777 family beta-barrel protein [Devosia neptuniae]|uniref:DUF5777 family beta-barrel protein n=1 Tax=Devosia TaxID=46913 RepID=UPI0022AF6B0E|nr:DUF5777 family beta-barrel protein [Devosia neptuniae]MCZ4346508.1 outer membrane beta-barrel protein [Devosia neptuniae]
MSLRLRHTIWRAGAWCTLCLAAPAIAQSDVFTGDGSHSDNDRLTPGIYPADPVLANGNWLREPHDPFFDVDWSVALRGSYTKSTSGERFDVRTIPSVTLSHAGSRSNVSATGSAEIVQPINGQIDVSALRLSGSLGYALDSDTTLDAAGSLSVTRSQAGTPGVASNIEVAPLTISGGGDLGVTRQFGKFNVELTGSADRTVYQETTLSDGTRVNNADQDAWALNTGLRVGFQITPIFEVFGRASVGRDIFDVQSASLGLKPDATTSSFEAGVTGKWNEVLEASASTGVTLRRFDAINLGEVTAQTYDASLTFRPDPTIQMTAGLSTTVAPPGPSGLGSTRIGYAADGEVAYTVNSWVSLRALANWSSASYIGSTDTETGYGFGAGGDYKVNAHTALTADYNFDKSDSSTNGPQEAHQVSVGITVSR